MQRTIVNADLWSQDDDPVEILTSAIYDEFDLIKDTSWQRNLYNEIDIFKNCAVNYYMNDEIIASYSNVVLFLEQGNVVRVVLLNACDMDEVISKSFNERCLPDKQCINDFVKIGKMSVIVTDLKQKTKDKKFDVQLGSVDRMKLLVAMMQGSITSYYSSGNEIVPDSSVVFKPKMKIEVRADLDKYKIYIRHEGVFVLNEKRWLLLQIRGYDGVKTWVSPKVKVLQNGFGSMFAVKNIKKDEVVAIRGGHVLSRDEMYNKTAFDGYFPISDNFVLASRTAEEYPAVKLWIDHSCDPNVGIDGEITLVAMRDLKAGEKLTIDFAMVDNEPSQFKCSCGSKNCRGTITGYDWKIKELQEKYNDYFALYLKKKFHKNFLI